jgi:Mrp family chromosome partitioning ATPase
MAAVAGASLAAAEILLTQVLHRVPPAKPLVLHILSLDRTVGQPVTRAFCTKAAEQVGNVLLAEAGPSPARCCALTQAIVPDASVTRLSYATLPLSALDVVRRGPLALLGAAAYDPAAYDMVLLESPCGNHRLDATLISGACSATVLIARAGVTTLREVQAASNAIRQAGGLLLGAVLAGAPPPPKWLQLLGVRR